MKKGYIRAASRAIASQQRDDLKAYGVDIADIYQERTSTKEIKKKEYEHVLDLLRPGDELVVATLFCFPLTLLQVIELFDGLRLERISVYCIKEEIENNGLFHTLLSYHKLSRSERSLASLPDPKKNPNVGRKKGMTQKGYERSLAIAEMKRQGYTVSVIKEQLGIKSNRVIYEALQLHGTRKKEQ